MKIVLIGAELEENLGLRYMAAGLERDGHEIHVKAFNSDADLDKVVAQVTTFDPQLAGLSMVFTGRAPEFCRLAQALRDGGYRGHIVAGGHFASFNCERLLQDFPAFDSIALGEGEEIICALAEHLEDPGSVPGLCYRKADGSIGVNPSKGNPENLDALPFPKRTTFHSYYGKPIASVLTSRGCWRDCAFCSINAWYKRGGGKKFRVRSVDNIVAEMKELYFQHGVRIFNMQDDNFFLPDPAKALERFRSLRDGLRREGIGQIAMAVKARPDSIHRDSVAVLDELGLFRVFLGVENASQHALLNLNRKCELEQILKALEILNDFDVHVAFNLLIFEPDTVMDDIRINLRFMERHLDNPLNFCRAEAYAGTGLEAKLLAEGRLLGDYFGFDYRLGDPRSESFHQIANYAFFDRNFSDFGLHYFNMQVDFYFQLLRRFYPQALTQTLRAASRSFIKQTNIDTHQLLCEIYDFVAAADPGDRVLIRAFAKAMRERVDERSRGLHLQGERILRWLEEAHERDGQPAAIPAASAAEMPAFGCWAAPYRGIEGLRDRDLLMSSSAWATGQGLAPFLAGPIPYDVFRGRLMKAQQAVETPAAS